MPAICALTTGMYIVMSNARNKALQAQTVEKEVEVDDET